MHFGGFETVKEFFVMVMILSAYLINRLDQIFILIAESEKFTFQIYLWKYLRDIKV